MSCTHDCGCSAETRDARTDDWGHTSPLSPQNADLREFQPAEPSQPLGTTVRCRAIPSTHSGTSGIPAASPEPHVKALGLLSRAFARESERPWAWSEINGGEDLPAEPSQPLGDVPASERPREAVLPRPITPEDVRVGMVVERRKGEAAHRDRVRRIDGCLIDGSPGWPYLWWPGHEEGGWTLWLVEDEPAPVDPDAEALDQMAQAMANLDGSDDADEWVPWAEVALDALRETHDVTARAEQ